jgi:23S rRNA pseudouridine1911/1915/1917 synthase
MMNNTNVTAAQSDTDKRIDVFITEMLPERSRSYVQKLLKNNAVTVNGKDVKANYKIKEGDFVNVEIPQDEELSVEAEDIPLDIIYEDEDILIVNKPKDMVVHPAAGHYSGTLVNAVMNHCRDNLSGINGVLRPGIVHRIDKDTTGALIVCKNDRAHRSLAAQLEVHSISRKYIAIVHGHFKESEFTITTTIGRHPNDRKKMAINVKNGKNAVTDVKVLKELKGYSLIECTLHTGRTHQIRVHMASVGHPVLGDEVYGPKKCPIKGLQGQCLHAYLIGFIHPSTGEYTEYTAPLPDYMNELLRKLT